MSYVKRGENIAHKAISNKNSEEDSSTAINLRSIIGKSKNNPLSKKQVAAIAAVLQYIETETKQEYGNVELNSWKLSMYEDSMRIRQLWQRRVGAVAGGPVGQSAYPLLKFHHH